jgi:hypothetical protein
LLAADRNRQRFRFAQTVLLASPAARDMAQHVVVRAIGRIRPPLGAANLLVVDDEGATVIVTLADFSVQAVPCPTIHGFSPLPSCIYRTPHILSLPRLSIR